MFFPRSSSRARLLILLLLLAFGVFIFMNSTIRSEAHISALETQLKSRQIASILNTVEKTEDSTSKLTSKPNEDKLNEKNYIEKNSDEEQALNMDLEMLTLPQSILEEPKGTYPAMNVAKGDMIGNYIVTTEVPRKQRLKEILKCIDSRLESERIQYGNYWLLRNIFIGEESRNIGCAEAITLTTIGDYTFFDNLPLLVSRWLAPISFAVYAPGYDINATMTSIQYVRNCLPESMLITSYITFHIYFPASDMPDYIPLSDSEALDWPFDCEASTPPYENVDRKKMYKTSKNLTYPINVARNIARKSVNTYFIFASDIELIPSPNLSENFLDFVLRNHSYFLDPNVLRVFPLPVFELESNASIPESKSELVKMLYAKMAIPFHSKVCANCHFVPKQIEWIDAADTDELSVFSIGKREGKFRYWEPFYISNNKEPVFDERVTWEGQSNKRIQNFAMCLMGYEYHVLHPAFLVHTPGIKYYYKNSPRYKFVPAMNRLIKKKIEPEYRILYGKNQNCLT